MATAEAAAESESVLARFVRRTRIILEMIKFEHTIFMMPFALMAAVIAGRGQFHGPAFWTKIVWVVVAMVGARSAAMAFNRLVDRVYDARNPRTAMRALPAGRLTPAQVGIFIVVSSALLVFAAAMLNRLALELSPVALLVVFGYSYTKRFTALSHVVLGVALAIAPVGAWIAITGHIAAPAVWLGLAVVCWLTGFDIIYALQDVDFDRSSGLRSIPAWLGNARALVVSRASHTIMVAFLALAGWSAHLGLVYFIGVGLVAALMAYEQSLVKADDLSRLDMAFFTLNGYISVGLCLMTIVDVAIGK